MNSICSNGCRIAKCMKEYFVYRKNYKGTFNSMLLAKSLYQKLWDDSPFLLKQLPGIGMVTAKALHSMGIKSFEALAEADPRKIEIVTGRKYPFGNHIKESLSSLPPEVDLKLEEVECPRHGKTKLIVTLTRLPQSYRPIKRHYADMFVGSEEDNQILFHEKIRVDEFSSPYSAVVLVSHPQQGKLTIKADLIFDEYIGIDLHRKLQLMERNSNARSKRGGMPSSSFPPPEEVYIIDDDSEPLPQAAVKELPKSGDSNSLLDSMPSFNLLDEEFGEAEPATVNDEDECKIITERTVFDHIREKAKSFPVLAASKHSAYTSASEAYNLTRNAQQLELQVEALEEKQRNELSPHAKVDSFSGFEEELGDNEYLTLQTHVISEPHFTDDDKGKHGLQTGESKIIVTEETIFDHIKRKANSFPAVSQFSLNTPGTYSKLNQASRDSDAEVASMEMLSFDISMMKENKRPRPASSNISSTWNHQSPPVESKKNCCSLETATETREVDPFVGFKSVFSFL